MSETDPSTRVLCGFNRCVDIEETDMTAIRALQARIAETGNHIPGACAHLCAQLMTNKSILAIQRKNNIPAGEWNVGMRKVITQAEEQGLASRPTAATVAYIALRREYVSLVVASPDLQAEIHHVHTSLGQHTERKATIDIARIQPDYLPMFKHTQLADIRVAGQGLESSAITLRPLQPVHLDHWRIALSSP